MSNQAQANFEREFLLANVGDSVEVLGYPCPVAVFGPDAFAVVVGKLKGANMPLVGASKLGAGRCVIFGNPAYMYPRPDAPAARTLLGNCVRWAARGTKGSLSSVAATGYYQQDLMASIGANVTKVNGDSLDNANLARHQVLFVEDVKQLGTRRESLDAVHVFIQNGGGFVAGGIGWLGTDMAGLRDSHPGNSILRYAGLSWTILDRIDDNMGRLSTARDLYGNTNALDAWDAMVRRGDRSPQTGLVTLNAVGHLPRHDSLLLPLVKAELDRERWDITIPTLINPVREYWTKALIFAADTFTNVDRSASDFPGVCVDKPVAVPVTLVVEVGTKDVWHSTGLYAPAGQFISVSIEDSESGTKPREFSVQIGSHSDKLFISDEWQRFPNVTTKTPATKGPRAALSLSSHFGGLIYICTESEGPQRPLRVSVTGGVPAPFFVLGKTSLGEWRNNIRYRGAPWGELQGDKIIITVPSSYLAGLDDPEPLLRQWDAVMDNMADFCGISRSRPRPFRIVGDVEITNGGLHAGYPIMFHVDAHAAISVDVARLRTADAFPLYHELGHNHQKDVWTWAGTREVTNNVLAAHVYSSLWGLGWGQAWSDQFRPAKVRGQLENFVAGDRRSIAAADDVYCTLYLAKYAQLQTKYGWEPFRRMFAFYEALPSDEEPKSDSARIDLWVRTFSSFVGENLVPFYKSWGFSIGPDVEAALTGLPVSDLRIETLLTSWLE